MKKQIIQLTVFVTISLILISLGCKGRAKPDKDGNAFFRSAKPIWPKGRETEMNLFVGFRTVFNKPADGKTVLNITGSSLYRISLNGEFIGHGPARGPHDYYRVDKWNLDNLKDKNILTVEVAGYNANSFYLLDQPSFLQAEVVSGDTVLASTAGKGTNFKAYVIEQKVQKVRRYAFQRTFSEYYRLDADFDQLWRNCPKPAVSEVKSAVLPEKKLLERRVPYPKFQLYKPLKHISTGSVETDVETKLKKFWWMTVKKGKLTTDGKSVFKSFPDEEFDVEMLFKLQRTRSNIDKKINKPFSANDSFGLSAKSFCIIDFGTNFSGFLGSTIKCESKTELFLTFDEILIGDDVDFTRLGCVNAVGCELEPGIYNIETFEPYTMRYLKIIVLDGKCEISNVYLRDMANPQTSRASFECSDNNLNRIFGAAVETARQNSVDIFTDCPSRERAGWLCDSFFTSRVVCDLSGNTTVEKNFLENYLLAEKFKYLPDGMLAMCYPADHYDGVFIPNWAMWFVVELEEYLERSGDRELVDALEPKVMALFDYFKKFKNDDGLLEKLENWIFIEWSKANEFIQELNYPTNMLYAGALSAAGRMYGRSELLTEAENIRKVIREQSFNGQFFVDNAARNKEGRHMLKPTNNTTEVCQYYAFFFDVATPESHNELWQRLVNEFGPKREETKAYPDVYPTNMLVGNMLRLELLSRYGFCRQLRQTLPPYFLYMAEKTGTLWEHVSDTASCNHGFASHAAHCLYRDILGIHKIDRRAKIIYLRFSDVDLKWCKGKIPVEDGLVSVSWEYDDKGKFTYKADVPAGYKIKVNDQTAK